MRRPIDPTVDVVFKEILGSDHHRNLLINFLNAVLGYRAGERVVDVVLRNPFAIKAFRDGKLSVVDVKALDQKGREFQIEIQVSGHHSLPERMLYTWCSLYYGRISKGEAYSELAPVISIWLLTGVLPAFPMLPRPTETGQFSRPRKQKTDLVHLPFGIHCAEAGCALSDHFAIHVLQLKNWPMADTIEDDKGRWLSFFKYGKNIEPDDPPGWMDTPEMREAMGILRKFSEQEENYHLYLSRLDEKRAELTRKNEMVRVQNRLKQEIERAEQERAAKIDALYRAEQDRAAKIDALYRAEQDRAAKIDALNRAEQERAAKIDALYRAEQERAAKSTALRNAAEERAAKEAALVEIERLRQLLKQNSGPDSQM